VLIIRDAQFTALEEASLAGWLQKHLDQHFPQLRASYPGEKYRLFIRDAIARARARGLTQGSQVVHWVNLMAAFGQRFDEDQRYPWVSAILNGSGNPSAKLQALVDHADVELSRTVESV
jgi:hypothetical protein